MPALAARYVIIQLMCFLPDFNLLWTMKNFRLFASVCANLDVQKGTWNAFLLKNILRLAILTLKGEFY